MRIVLGAGKSQYEGWLNLQEEDLNMLDENDFLKYCNPNEVDVFLSEHVFEHLELAEGKIAARNIFKFLKPGGYLRVGVPDGYFDNEDYQQMVQIGGPGSKDHPASSHKIVYNYHLLTEVFESAGFVVNLLEYCDEKHGFHYKYWNPKDGMIGRSYRFDTRNSKESLGFVSLILDAHKPLIIENEKTHG